MKNLQYLILIFIFLLSSHIKAEKVTSKRASIVAENWKKQKLEKANCKITKHSHWGIKNDTIIHIVNFDDGTSLIISGDDNTAPILGYSEQGEIELNNLRPEFESWLNYYAEMIENNKKHNSQKKEKQKWEKFESGVRSKSIQSSVPSLFEAKGSSCWAGWFPYYSQAPQSAFTQGTNGCVPGRLAEIMKYYKYPKIGENSHTYTYNGVTISEILTKYSTMKKCHIG